MSGLFPTFLNAVETSLFTPLLAHLPNLTTIPTLGISGSETKAIIESINNHPSLRAVHLRSFPRPLTSSPNWNTTEHHLPRTSSIIADGGRTLQMYSKFKIPEIPIARAFYRASCGQEVVVPLVQGYLDRGLKFESIRISPIVENIWRLKKMGWEGLRVLKIDVSSSSSSSSSASSPISAPASMRIAQDEEQQREFLATLEHFLEDDGERVERVEFRALTCSGSSTGGLFLPTSSSSPQLPSLPVYFPFVSLFTASSTNAHSTSGPTVRLVALERARAPPPNELMRGSDSYWIRDWHVVSFETVIQTPRDACNGFELSLYDDNLQKCEELTFTIHPSPFTPALSSPTTASKALYDVLRNFSVKSRFSSTLEGLKKVTVDISDWDVPPCTLHDRRTFDGAVDGLVQRLYNHLLRSSAFDSFVVRCPPDDDGRCVRRRYHVRPKLVNTRSEGSAEGSRKLVDVARIRD